MVVEKVVEKVVAVAFNDGSCLLLLSFAAVASISHKSLLIAVRVAVVAGVVVDIILALVVAVIDVLRSVNVSILSVIACCCCFLLSCRHCCFCCCYRCRFCAVFFLLLLQLLRC